jgi:hypothetical protein
MDLTDATGSGADIVRVRIAKDAERSRTAPPARSRRAKARAGA